MKNSIICSILFVFITLQGAMAGKLEQSVKAFYAAVDAGDFEKASSYLAPDVKVYMPFSPEPLNKEAYKMLGMGFKAGFPDMQHEIMDILVEKDKASARGIFKGTNTGSMQGNPPTGNKVVLPFIVNYDLDHNGKIKNQYVEFNVASFNAQLMKGLPPMPDNAAEDAKANIHRAYEALNRKDWNAFAALCDEKNYTDVKPRCLWWVFGMPWKVTSSFLMPSRT